MRKDLTGLRVTRDNLLVQELEVPSTRHGFVIPETAKDRPHQGIVRVVGPGLITDNGLLIPPEFDVDDLVYFNPFAGHEIRPDWPKHKVVSSSRDVFAGLEAESGAFQVIEHNDGTIHLAGEDAEGCAECAGVIDAEVPGNDPAATAEERAAKERLAEERARFRERLDVNEQA